MSDKIKKLFNSTLKFALQLSVIFIIGTLMFSSKGTPVERDPNRKGEILSSNGIEFSDEPELMAESEMLKFYFNSSNGSFYIEEKNSNQRWFSNPTNEQIENMGINEGSFKVVNSQIAIKYMNSYGQEITMDNRSFSVDLKQYTIEKTDNGIMINYSFAHPQSDEIFPRALTVERYTEIESKLEYSSDINLLKKMYALIETAKLSGDELNRLTERYGALKYRNLYILRDAQLNPANRRNLTNLFNMIEYTKDDLESDMEEIEYTGGTGSGESFIIPVKYVLDNDSLSVSIDAREIKYIQPDSGFFPLISIDVHNYFAAASQNDEGYIFIPDGSGSMIDFKVRSNRNTSLEGYIYGKDTAILNLADNKLTENFTMPVFGIINDTEKKAVLAVVEKGASMSRIKVSTGGDGVPLNRVSVAFDTMNFDYIPIGKTATRENFYVFSNDICNEEFQVRYYFLSDDKANISNMAKKYRENLQSRNILSKELITKSPDVLLEFKGAIDVISTMAGIPYQTTMALTDFSELKQVLVSLKEKGISNPALHYTGVQKGGYLTALQNNFKPDKSLGTAKELKNLIDYVNDEKIMMFFGPDFYKITKEPIFAPFRKKEDAVRNLTKEIHTANGAYYLNPLRYEGVFDSYISSINKIEVSGIGPLKIGEMIYSDFNPENPITRQNSLEYLKSALSNAKNSNMKILSDGANDYMFPFADIIKDTPYGDSSYIISSHSVPFYQMVAHGYIDYSSKPINYESEPHEAFLKSVMTGSIPGYKLIAKPGYILNETDYSDWYASGFEEWEDKIVKWNNISKPLYEAIRSKEFTEFWIVESGITISIFENINVIVNLSDHDYEYNGMIVKSKDFYWHEGN